MRLSFQSKIFSLALSLANLYATNAENKIFMAPQNDVIEDEWIVVLQQQNKGTSKTSQDDTSAIVERLTGSNPSISLKQTYSTSISGFLAQMTVDEAKELAKSPEISYIEQNMMVSLPENEFVQPNVNTENTLGAWNEAGSWGLDRIDQKDNELDGQYEPFSQGEGVSAYVIDTGILTTHNDFDGRATWGTNTADNTNTDCGGHGTHVAGTVGGTIYGVAKKVDLIAVKVLNCAGSGTLDGVIRGIEWVQNDAAGKSKPATANLSLGSGYSLAVNEAVRELHQSGVVTVAAAGNSNADACRYSPAGERSIVTVGSTTTGDARSYFSNYGECVDIFAPGSSIKAPWIGNNDATNTISGTSMASPHVCGAAALYLGASYPRDSIPNLLKERATPNALRDVHPGSPNKLLFVDKVLGPTASPTSLPPSTVPLQCIKTGLISESNSGTPFDDKCHPGIRSIQVRTGWWFDAIQITYLDGPGGYYGGTDGGDAHFAELEDGEGIIEVSAMEHLDVRYGLEYLRFKTDTGRQINFDSGGETSNGETKTWRADDGYVLGGIHGKSGDFLNTIGLYWVPKLDSTPTPSARPSQNRDGPTVPGSSTPTVSSTATPKPSNSPNVGPPTFSWNIERKSSEVVTGEGNPHIQVDYKVSKRSYSAKVFQEDCVTSLTSGLLPVRTSHVDSDETGFIDLQVLLDVDQGAIEDDGSIWTPDASGAGGSFKFCLSTSLYRGNGTEDENRVTRNDVLIDVSVSNVGGFGTSGIMMVAQDIDTVDLAIEYQGEIDAYQCDKEGVVDEQPVGPFDLLHVCIKVKEDESVIVNGVLDFAMKQGSLDFSAIHGGIIEDLNKDIVGQDCNMGYCRVTLKPLDAFFLEADEPAGVFGVVSVGTASAGRSPEQKSFEVKVSLVHDEPCKESAGLKNVLRHIRGARK